MTTVTQRQRIQYSPGDSSPIELERHGQRIAERLQLTPMQVAVLVSELRNTLSTIALVDLEAPLEDVHRTDIRSSLARLLAVATALSASVKWTEPKP